MRSLVSDHAPSGLYHFAAMTVEKLSRMTPEEVNRRLSLTPPAGCRNSFSSCNDGKATSDDLHRRDWDGSFLRVGPGGSSPTVLPSRRGALLDVDRGSLLDADQQIAGRAVLNSWARIQGAIISDLNQ